MTARNDLDSITRDNPFQRKTFQGRVSDWMLACFGADISSDRVERGHRYLEESLELVQTCDVTREEAHQLVDYVFDRPVGDRVQETGSALTTLAALCHATGIDMASAGETELARIWTLVEKIRAKQAAKPKGSAIPIPMPPRAPGPTQAQTDALQALADDAQRLGLGY
jgi:hypothetical protein